jgi:hypothetical protein
MTSQRYASDIERIYHEWHDRARALDVEGLLSLYTEDALLESPLVPALMDWDRGMLRGHEELQRFFRKGTDKRPNALVRWHRPPEYFTNGRTLIWEYPREAPDGDQIDILETMDLSEGRIKHHRIYWGWFGVQHLLKNALSKR